MWSIFRIILSLAVLLTGCDRPGENEGRAGRKDSPSREPVKVAGEGEVQEIQLNWIGHWKDEGEREKLVHEIKKEFEFIHPQVKINLVWNKDIEGTETDYKRRTAAEIVRMVETGEIAWDVIFMDSAIYEMVSDALGDPSWVREHLVDFAAVPGFLESQKDFIVEDPRYRNKVGGIFTGPFIENYLMSLWYNRSVAVETGIAVKERDMSFDDLLGYAEELHRYNVANNSSLSFIKLYSWNRLDFLFENLYKSLFENFHSAVEVAFTARKKEAFLETLLAFEKISKFQPVLNEHWEEITTSDGVREILFRNDTLFIMGGTFMYNQFRGIDEERSRKMRPVENPVLRRANGLIGDYTPVFAVMKRSRHRDLAVDLLMSWATPKNAEKWVRYTKNLTGTKGNLSAAASGGLEATEDVYERYILDMEEKYSGTPMMYLRTPTYALGEKNPVTSAELREKLARILEGKLSAREYFEEVMGRMEGAGQ